MTSKLETIHKYNHQQERLHYMNELFERIHYFENHGDYSESNYNGETIVYFKLDTRTITRIQFIDTMDFQHDLLIGKRTTAGGLNQLPTVSLRDFMHRLKKCIKDGQRDVAKTKKEVDLAMLDPYEGFLKDHPGLTISEKTFNEIRNYHL